MPSEDTASVVFIVLTRALSLVSPATSSTSRDVPPGATPPAAGNCPGCRPARTVAAGLGCPQSHDRTYVASHHRDASASVKRGPEYDPILAGPCFHRNPQRLR